jgi:hypothetical protein
MALATRSTTGDQGVWQSMNTGPLTQVLKPEPPSKPLAKTIQLIPGFRERGCYAGAVGSFNPVPRGQEGARE